MKILGTITEYNPFHNGHKYHLQESRNITGADYVVAVMSGNFTQRGEAAMMDKWERSRLAVENGVDLVLELPFVFACARGERFAAGAVDILAGIGATHISFGSENGNLGRLKKLVVDMEKNRDRIDAERRLLMNEGNSYARSLQQSVDRILGAETAALMLEPNNILAIEYLRRIMQKEYDIEPVTVKRHGSGYFEKNEHAGFAGATAIRDMIKTERLKETAAYVPDNVYETLSDVSRIQIDSENAAFMLIKAEILKSSSESLADIYCMGEGLHNKLKKEIVKAGSLNELISSVVSRRYTEAAIRRLMIYILLGIREHEPANQLYARVLAAGPKGRDIVRLMKKQEISSIPVITNINKEADICDSVYDTLKYDLLASDMYNLICGRDIYRFSDRVVRPYIK